ncbi:MAG: preprotein translocase subunit SecG [Leptospiraceae bacterium]|nr:preprotein translocase subunit SecG [Leptospiraceae bacterium]MDW8307262.1 preprotein translocase subunit SecG [Leptospiraceae bacterium]
MEILATILTILFIIDCVLLILIVLLQSGRSAGLGTFGGSSNTILGASSADVLTKITVGLAAGFMLLALSLAFIKSRQYARPVLEENKATQQLTPVEEVPSQENKKENPSSP